MDLLFKRYASPFLLLDQVIQYGDLSDFVSLLWENLREEQEWDYFLAKVYDKSFNEFRESMREQKPMSKQEIGATITESMNIMDTFIPDDEGVN